MGEKKRYNLKNILDTALWILLGAGTIVLSGAAIYKKDSNPCRSVEITIEGLKNNFFIDKADVHLLLKKMGFGNPGMKPLNTFDLAGMETILEKNVWIKSAELFFDNNDVLRINITAREPVVRIFDAAGSSFYVDSSMKKLPLNTKFSARLPVFTNFPVTKKSFSKADSNFLTGIINMATYILNDPFWMAQIEQIDITDQRTFEMIPKIGNQLIIFGTAGNYEEKFNNLLIFYKQVQSKVGWNKYASINVSYKDQVIAVKRGAGDIKLDSLRTIRLIKLLIANAQKQVNENVNTIQLVQPKENNSMPFSQPGDENFRDERSFFNDTLPGGQIANDQLPLTPAVYDDDLSKPKITHGMDSLSTSKTLKSKYNEKPNPAPLKKTWKPIIKKQARPKAVMPPKNDY